MHYQGLFWSAIIRALLSLRRDLGLSSERDTTLLEGVSEVENGHMDDDALASVLSGLCPVNNYQLIGRSLVGYLDFNKMGNLVVYLTASKHINDALHILGKQYEHILGMQAELSVKTDNNFTTVEYSPCKFSILNELRCYFLLALFRHLAGRKFDFESITSPPMQAHPVSLISALSQRNVQYRSGRVQLRIANDWCHVASFYYSQSVKKMLAASLEVRNEIPLKQQVKAVFQQAPSPARIRSEWVASQLGQTESAFRRQLRQETISFSALLKEFIHDHSCHLLLSGQKTDDAAADLGFSDRRSFERSFKEHTGISAGQLRQLGNRLRFQKGNSNLLEVVENLPPLPNSIRALLKMDAESMTIPNVVSLVQKDPIFQAHIMSKASRAIYGASPKNLEQAVGRNLGLNNIRHLAIVFAAQQQLTAQCRFRRVDVLTDAMLLSLTIYQRLFGFRQHTEEQAEVIKQLLLFGNLSLFLIFHDECVFADGALGCWEETPSFCEFRLKLMDEYGLCLYGATSLMLLRWGFNSEMNQQLWKLCSYEDGDQSTNLGAQVQLCHDIAFSALAHCDMKYENSIAGLDEAQIFMLNDVLKQWSSTAA